MSDGEPLLDNQLLQRLERLRIYSRRRATAPHAGESTSMRRGQSVEFADYREYQLGDDYRYIDWNIYSRLDRLFVKLFVEEHGLLVEVLLDTSRSMGWGNPGKLRYAARLAAAFAYIALRNGERFRLVTVSGERQYAGPPLLGRQHLPQVLQTLQSVVPAGPTHLAPGFARLANVRQGRAVTIVLSDLFDPAGIEHGLAALSQSGREVFVLHVLAPDERSPDHEGQIEWLDSETGAQVNMHVEAYELELYRQVLQEWTQSLQDQCARRGALYYQVSTDVPLEQLLVSQLRRGGLLR